jgi:hypothetical protein
MAKKMAFCNYIYFGQNIPVVPREKIDDDFSETIKLLISFDRVMLGLQNKARLIRNYLLYKID